MNDNVFWCVLNLCVVAVLIIITLSIWDYNVQAVKYYTEAGYEEVMAVGYSEPVWKKVK